MISEYVGLMQAAQAGDSQAYHRLLKAIQPRIIAYVQRRISNREIGNEVVQTIFLRIHVSRHTYNPSHPFEPWLFAIARNAVNDAYVKETKRASLTQALGQDDELSGSMESLSAAAKALEASFAKLPAEQQSALRLVKIDGMSMAAAAAHEGVTLPALKARVRRAYMAIVAEIKGDGDDDV